MVFIGHAIPKRWPKSDIRSGVSEKLRTLVLIFILANAIVLGLAILIRWFY